MNEDQAIDVLEQEASHQPQESIQSEAQQQPVESKQDRNWREMRQKLEHYEKKLADLEQKNQPKAVEEEDINLSDDDIVTAKDVKKLAKKMAREIVGLKEDWRFVELVKKQKDPVKFLRALLEEEFVLERSGESAIGLDLEEYQWAKMVYSSRWLWRRKKELVEKHQGILKEIGALSSGEFKNAKLKEAEKIQAEISTIEDIRDQINELLRNKVAKGHEA